MKFISKFTIVAAAIMLAGSFVLASSGCSGAPENTEINREKKDKVPEIAEDAEIPSKEMGIIE